MTERLDDLLKALPAPSLDHALDQLEPQVWRRIEARRPGPWMAGAALRFQIAAAALALVIGMALGWVNGASHDGDHTQSVLYRTYAESGPMAQLESGL
jgi:anti-sigma factor RsiW